MLFHYFPGYREARLKSCIRLMCLYQSWAPRLSRNCLLKQFGIRKQTAEYIYAGVCLKNSERVLVNSSTMAQKCNPSPKKRN